MADLPLSEHVLTPDQMGQADRAAARSGLSSYGLMIRAGEAVAASALRHYPAALRFVILAGPGNNGGDGYVAARALRRAGAAHVVFALGDPQALSGDAGEAWRDYGGAVQPLEDYQPQSGDVIIDAVFGAGLARDVPAVLARLIDRVTALGLPVLAVDLPSGLDGRTGQPRGRAFAADRSVTFMTLKPGHLLLPGRTLCGIVEVFDIGIPHRIIRAVAGRLAINGPAVWRDALPQAGAQTHKYRKGHLAVFSGPAGKTGAARLAARAALRAGAGLVTIACPPDAIAEHAAQLSAIMLADIGSETALAAWLADPRINAAVIGPGFGDARTLRRHVARLATRRIVLDADGLTAFRDCADLLFNRADAERGALVLTPHEGEFARLFPDLAGESRLSKVEKACAAAERARAVVLYKGADTVIAAPDGRALINTNAPPALATAGSGDVLSGVIGGLLAQDVAPFEAAAIGAWLHATAGNTLGPGLTAETLADAIRPFAD